MSIRSEASIRASHRTASLARRFHFSNPRERIMSKQLHARRAGLLYAVLAVTALGAVAMISTHRSATSMAAEAPAAKTLDPAAWDTDHVGTTFAGIYGKRRVPVLPSQRGRHDLGHEQAQPHDSRSRRRQSRARGAESQSRDEAAGRRSAVAHGGQLRRRSISEAIGRVCKLDSLSTGSCLAHRPGPARACRKSHLECQHLRRRVCRLPRHGHRSRDARLRRPLLDCFTCHGDVPARNMPNDPKKLMPLAGTKDSAAVTSICGMQCHVVLWQSKSTGRRTP